MSNDPATSDHQARELLAEALDSIQNDAEVLLIDHADCCDGIGGLAEDILSALDTVRRALSRPTVDVEGVEWVRQLLDQWDEWEAAVLLDPSVWSHAGGFHVNGNHYDEYIRLQDMRLQTRAALASLGEGYWLDRVLKENEADYETLPQAMKDAKFSAGASLGDRGAIVGGIEAEIVAGLREQVTRWREAAARQGKKPGILVAGYAHAADAIESGEYRKRVPEDGRPFGQPATHEPSLASRLGPSGECQAQEGE